jgi:hypothetical protein
MVEELGDVDGRELEIVAGMSPKTDPDAVFARVSSTLDHE